MAIATENLRNRANRRRAAISRRRGGENDLLSCGDIQPPKEVLFPKLVGLKLIAWTLAGATLLILLTLCIRRVRARASVEVGLVGLIIGTAAAACYNWERFAAWLTQYGEGEPIELMQGVSVWPTILLRSLSIVLSIYLLWRAWQKLNKNLYEIAREMNLPMPNLAIAAERETDRGLTNCRMKSGMIPVCCEVGALASPRMISACLRGGRVP